MTDTRNVMMPVALPMTICLCLADDVSHLRLVDDVGACTWISCEAQSVSAWHVRIVDTVAGRTSNDLFSLQSTNTGRHKRSAAHQGPLQVHSEAHLHVNVGV